MTLTDIGVEFLDRVTAHDLDGLCALVTDDWTMHGGPPGLPPGHAGVHELFRHIGPVRQTWTVEDVVAAGDRVVDGRVAETWRCADDLGRLLQLGARIGAA